MTFSLFHFPLSDFRSRKTVGKTVSKTKTSKNNIKMIKNMSIILSEHFRLTEFTISLVAYRAGRNRQQVIGHLVKR